MRLCCHTLEKSPRERDKTLAADTRRQDKKTLDGDAFLYSKVSTNDLQDVAQQLEPRGGNNSSAVSVDCTRKQDNRSNDIPGVGDYLSSSKSDVLHPRLRRLRDLRHPRVLGDEPPTSQDNGWVEESNRERRSSVNKYHPVELYFDSVRQVSTVLSSFLFKKGVAFSIFYWVYIVAFVYAVCYMMSSVVTPFSIIGVIVKVMLVHYFPYLIQLEVFRAVDHILALIYQTFP